MKSLLLTLPLAAITMTPSVAATITLSSSTTSTIPDGSSSGLGSSLVATGYAGEQVVSATVSINLSASAGTAFLGDIYAYITNGTELAVLLNRPGRRTGAPGGYADNQPLTAVFSDAAANDIHNYRLPLSGAHATPISAPVTGMWLPDGRAVDPSVVLDTSPRTATLSSFTGKPADGTWTLFVADLSSGNTHKVDSWSLTLETVPEPSSALLGLLSLPLLLGRRKR